MPTTIELSLEEAHAKASVLIEALPWLKRYRGAIVVIKFGGNAMISPELAAAFAEDMVFLHHAGLRPVVVHGGGPQISAGLAEKGIASEFRGGYRYTSDEAIGVVRDVLRNRVNRSLVNDINQHGNIARSLSGEQANLFGGRTRGVMIDGELQDLGRVGDILEVDPSAVLDALDAGRIPVITSIAYDLDDPERLLNVNADSAAAAIAIALNADKLLVLTDVAGLYSDWPNRDSLVSVISTAELRELLPELESGMIPKMNACLDAVDNGVRNAAIIDGRIEHSILLEVFTQSGIGTQVVSETE
ncbi:acetylglutamate kinase [Mycetocola tolaasinivorans]|uniref:Acetylglutamate kinase n=1 Tax=Mycetocola tolaasinivorans TaxID=76635 RepID=A0A3L7A720_9MICO|nr:acetylglutamate kinase [Mycetocola tolaasinivorans]RLP76133.1 acetylglutamate kinase [Mycetocola tolaasinivorans]